MCSVWHMILVKCICIQDSWKFFTHQVIRVCLKLAADWLTRYLYSILFGILIFYSSEFSKHTFTSELSPANCVLSTVLVIQPKFLLHLIFLGFRNHQRWVYTNFITSVELFSRLNYELLMWFYNLIVFKCTWYLNHKFRIFLSWCHV